MAKRTQPLTRHNPTEKRLPKKPGWQECFLEEFAKKANISEACRQAGIHRSVAYELKKTDPAFASSWQDAKADAIDRLASVGWDRAENGWDQPVYQNGIHVGDVRKYDNGLLRFFLAALDPETYGSKSRQELTGPDGGPVEITEKVPLELLPTEDILEVKRLFEKALALAKALPPKTESE